MTHGKLGQAGHPTLAGKRKALGPPWRDPLLQREREQGAAEGRRSPPKGSVGGGLCVFVIQMKMKAKLLGQGWQCPPQSLDVEYGRKVILGGAQCRGGEVVGKELLGVRTGAGAK